MIFWRGGSLLPALQRNRVPPRLVGGRHPVGRVLGVLRLVFDARRVQEPHCHRRLERHPASPLHSPSLPLPSPPPPPPPPPSAFPAPPRVWSAGVHSALYGLMFFK